MLADGPDQSVDQRLADRLRDRIEPPLLRLLVGMI
jgi:hypothetical protein